MVAGHTDEAGIDGVAAKTLPGPADPLWMVGHPVLVGLRVVSPSLRVRSESADRIRAAGLGGLGHAG